MKVAHGRLMPYFRCQNTQFPGKLNHLLHCSDKAFLTPLLKLSLKVLRFIRAFLSDGNVTRFAQWFVFAAPDDNVVEHFDFEQLSGTYQVAGHFDVGLR